MKRRVILATCLAGIIAGSAGLASSALAAPQATNLAHNVCVAVAKNGNYGGADYYCVTLP